MVDRYGMLGVYKTLICAKLKKSGAMWLVVAQSISNYFS